MHSSSLRMRFSLHLFDAKIGTIPQAPAFKEPSKTAVGVFCDVVTD